MFSISHCDIYKLFDCRVFLADLLADLLARSRSEPSAGDREIWPTTSDYALDGNERLPQTMPANPNG
jgi:hypothetical protein